MPKVRWIKLDLTDNIPLGNRCGLGSVGRPCGFCRRQFDRSAWPTAGYSWSPARRAGPWQRWQVLMLAGGLTPKLQFGEIRWWFQANASGMALYDADTQAAAQSALGRALATFHTPNDDPSANSYADANFLLTCLYNYVAAIQSYVLSQCAPAIFELLWPMDVNDPDNCKLLRYINLPSPSTTRPGSGFDYRPHRGLPVSRNQSQPRPSHPVRAVPMEGTLLGSRALPLPDGPLIRHLVVDARVRERQSPRVAGHQTLGLRSRLPVSDGPCRHLRATTVRSSTDHQHYSDFPIPRVRSCVFLSESRFVGARNPHVWNQ